MGIGGGGGGGGGGGDTVELPHDKVALTGSPAFFTSLFT